MQITVPDYYKEFVCIAGECPDTCCAGWQIMIDKKSLVKYKKTEGVFKNRLFNGIDWTHKCFRQYEGRCEFLNEENLCDIYQEAGADMLCNTCKKYPRHYEEYEGLTEISLSLSCPEVARILLNKEEPVTFKSVEKNIPEEEYEDFDYLLFSALMDVRDKLIEILQNRNLSIKQRLCKALVYVHDFQVCINKGELFKLETLTSLHEKRGYEKEFFEKIYRELNQSSDIKDIIISMWENVIPKMEVLRSDWRDFLKENLEKLYRNDNESYKKKIDEFKKGNSDWEIQQEQLLVYWIFTYFGGAVYDGDAFTKLKMAIISTYFVRDVCVGMYVKNSDHYSVSELIKVAGWYSRELEHSDDNLNELEKILREDKSFRFANMLKLVSE